MGWSRNILLNQIKAKAFKRQKQLPKQHNFKKALPTHLLKQADEMLKSNYNLDFLGINKPMHERQFENRLIEKLKHFILELGYGFSFVGNQYRIELNRKEYFIDLLFFHRKLRCLVGIDLKIGSFEPEFAGKMNFYLNLLDDHVRMKDENPSIGIILCAEKNSVEVDYALKGIDKPIAVAEYKLKKSVPKKWQRQLPSAKELTEIIREEFKKEK
jgi:predicted nuclease of restriction endonuclease-like (RecB) superfamily